MIPYQVHTLNADEFKLVDTVYNVFCQLNSVTGKTSIPNHGGDWLILVITVKSPL